MSPLAAPALALAAPVLTLAATVAVVLLLQLAFEVVKLRRVKRGATPLGTLGVRRARIGTSRTVATPTAIGYVHPAVVVPEGFADRVDAREWDAIVAHECAHLARLDDWAKALQSAVLRAGWWLPGLWILGRALDLERELASDERAAGTTGARRYAACLLRLATDRGADLLAPAFARRSHVAIRVERLLRPAPGGTPLLRAAALGAFTAAAFALVGAAVLAVPGTGARAFTVHHAARQADRVAPRRLAQRMRHPGQLTAPLRIALAPTRQAAGTAPRADMLARTSPPIGRRGEPASTVRHTVASSGRTASATLAGHTASAPVAARTRANAVVAARHRPARRTGAGRPAAVAVNLSAETLAFANVAVPRSRCRTCFGPMRSAEDAVGSPKTAFPAQGGSTGGGSAAIAADDPTAGPVSLGSPTIWFRIPTSLMQRP
ncbi:MAG TPA: M56 family metallopeptidase [Candidatus Elarobacter sp.]|nr:M56 family metallopeptidase [Candidatus Elarobacter sp.]